MKIYICGSMQKSVLRDELIRGLDGHEILDPSQHGLTDEKAYTDWDLAAIRQCDCVVAFMESSNPSGYGLAFEIGYACGINKPVIYLDALGNDWRQKYFGMVRSASQTASTIFDVFHHIKRLA